MNIHKYGHCCLLIQHKNVTILTDPGAWTAYPDTLPTTIDAIFITHEHQDHMHIDALKDLLESNKQVHIYTNSAVKKLLDAENIACTIMNNGDIVDVKGVSIEAFECMHAEIYEDFGAVLNTGVLIDNRFFYPGDAFIDPLKPIDILALPVSAPWLSIKDAINYAIKVAPKHAINVHDGHIKYLGGVIEIAPKKYLPLHNINYIYLNAGDSYTFTS